MTTHVTIITTNKEEEIDESRGNSVIESRVK